MTKTVFIATCLLVLIPNPPASCAKYKRNYFASLNSAGAYPTGDLSASSSGWTGTPYLPLHEISTPDFSLKINLPPPSSVVSNSLEPKPVEEAQEVVPQPSLGSGIIPQFPPAAVPVNAVAANVPGNGGAVYLGSGSLGVVSLGNGAYALGSGSLGYSNIRSQPRPTGTVPVYPPLPASPNLLPAAVPSPAPIQPPIPPNPLGPIPGNQINFNHPLLNQPQAPILDQNGYEYLTPNRIGFGMPNPRPLRLKVRQQFATPTTLQVQPQPRPQIQQIQPQLPSASFDINLPLSHPALG